MSIQQQPQQERGLKALNFFVVLTISGPVICFVAWLIIPFIFEFIGYLFIWGDGGESVYSPLFQSVQMLQSLLLSVGSLLFILGILGLIGVSLYRAKHQANTINKQDQLQQERSNVGLLISSGLLILIGLMGFLVEGFGFFPLNVNLLIGIPPFVIGGLWYRIGDQGKRSNVLIVITSGILLLYGGLVTYAVSTTADRFSGLDILVLYSFYLVVSFPLFTIAGVWFLVGMIGLAKQMLK